MDYGGILFFGSYSWAGSSFSDLHRKIQSLRKDLYGLLHSNFSKDNFTIITNLEHEIEKLVVQEEMHWKKRARINWLAYGDGNTNFFHSFASDRKRANILKGLQEEMEHGILRKVKLLIFSIIFFRGFSLFLTLQFRRQKWSFLTWFLWWS